MIQQTSRGKPNCCGNLHFVDDNTRTSYTQDLVLDSSSSEWRLASLRTWYQIPDDLNPRLAVRGEWCCNFHFRIGVYEAYILGGLRLPFNAFVRELLVRLGLGVCQFNPNAWRLVVSMQVLWREVFGGTVYEFLFCNKPSEINQSLGCYQFTIRGIDCRLIKSLVSSNRNQKMEFFFISGFWAENLIEVGRDTFPTYTGELGNLCPEGMFYFFNFLDMYYFYLLLIIV